MLVDFSDAQMLFVALLLLPVTVTRVVVVAIIGLLAVL